MLIDMQDIFRRYSFDIICQFSFGLDPHCLLPSLPTSILPDEFDLCSKITAERAMVVSPLYWKLKRFLNVGSERKLKEAISVVNSSAEAMIKERHRLRVGSLKDLLSRFMDSEDVDDKYLRDIVINFLLAGRDTIASALTDFFLLLSNNPRVEEKIRVELDSIMKPTQESPTFKQTREFHYVNSAIKKI
ncbi:putative cytochrome P450 [Medicago truncatula]|uniref:E-class P450, group I n=1 Tax=Medicago truncatula TaxID=3880 RepID=A2Q3J5_MEDTR|nr:E-class P450, group I [Medicago truncatula]RHN74348.1 putative cytochrome P450 [Medicago truncatula]